jgi:3-oxoacyl-[acyl-carrier-protein] synthase II
MMGHGEDICVTGLGAVSALGVGVDAHREALLAGRSGITQVKRFDTSRLGTHLGATWPGWDGIQQPDPGKEASLAETALPFPLHELALHAAREAWASSGASCAPSRVALVFGTCFGQGFDEFAPVARRIAEGLGLTGPVVTISTACSSSTNAIGLGRDLLRQGHVDAVIAGGADVLLREAFAGFSALGVLSAEPCAPFSEPVGTTLGEGAAFVVLERGSDASLRQATPWAAIHGYGLSADAYHETTPHPGGDGIARAIRSALHDAGWRPEDVDFVSAHATGTANNDRVEWAVLQRELGAPGHPPYVTASKGHVGHTQGASGALELVLALLCHRTGHVPPTLHFRGPRAACPADPIAQDTPRLLDVSRALKLSAAFGGANAVLAYSCRGTTAPRERVRRQVFVAGAGVVGPGETRSMRDLANLAGPPRVGACAGVNLDDLGIEGRRLDRSARLLTGAAALALSERTLSESLDRTGLFVGATRMPPESSRRCTDSIRHRGVGATSASAFARMSVNAPAGACTLALGLLGPTSTLSIGEGSGLLAVVLAAEWLAWRDDATAMIAGAVDELTGTRADETEGAACLALRGSHDEREGAVLVTGWAIGGAGELDETIARTLGVRRTVGAIFVDGPPDGVDASPRLERWLEPGVGVGVVHGSLVWGAAEASRSVVMAALAAAYVADGRLRSSLVVSARGASCVALLLERNTQT